MEPREEVEALVVGAGISGLACAWELQRRSISVLCLEASDRVGGALRSRRDDGFLVEAGANTVQETGELSDLLRALDMEDEVLRSRPGLPRFVYRHGVLHSVPQTIAAMFATTLVSARGKLRMMAELVTGRAEGGAEESVTQFVTRRFGAEALEALFAPLVSGTFAGDPARLSAAAAFPRLVELERNSGSVLRGLLRGRAGDTGRRARGALVSLRDGLESLPNRLAAALGDRLRCQAVVQRISAAGVGYDVESRSPGGTLDLRARKIVLTVQAAEASSLLAPIAAEAAAALSAVEAPPLVCVSLAWPRRAVAHPLDGFGFLVAPGENMRILGCLWPSSMFPNRAPGGQVLLTCFLGGAGDRRAVSLTDEELALTVRADLAAVLGAKGPPRVLSIDRYERAIPQYALGHESRMQKALGALGSSPGIVLAGSYLDGIAVGDCLKRGLRAAEQVAGERRSSGSMGVDFPPRGV